MNKSNRKYIVILIVLIAIFIIIKTNNKTEKIINFFDVDSMKIARIELSTVKDTLLMAKVNDTWMIEKPLEYTADQIRVENFFKRVLKSETSSLPVSESNDSLQKYELTDSLATMMKLYDANGKVLAAAFFGKMKGESNTPVRNENSNKVYRLGENVAYYLKPDLQTWREKTVAKIEEASIEKISILHGDEGFEITRSDSLWMFDDGKNSFSIDNENASLRQIFSALKLINSSKFKDNEFALYESRLANPDVEIGINILDGTNVYLRLAKDGEKNYIMQKDNIIETLYIQYESWAKRFLKSAVDFQD
ncbi:MAG: DUF4340 domain-containing protein [Candidatus Cloacimonadales bacterium]|nr:DUF4340 domain-containing protein [Candidatus Cloacimonadales bacterium]